MTDTQPVLPSQPWYTSEVQVRLFGGLLSGIISVGFRLVNLFGYEIKVAAADVDAIAANIAQLVAMVLLVLAIIKRQKSAVAPLTFTANGAALRDVGNPPLLDADPTKIPKEHCQ